MSKGLLIIRSKVSVRPQAYDELREIILRQKEEGVVVLPPFLEAVYIPDDIEVEFESLK